MAQMISEGTLVTAANVHACIDGLVVVRTTEKYRRALEKSGVADPTAAAETGRVIKYHVEGTAEVLWSFGPARKAQPMSGYKLPGHLEVAQTPASSMRKPASEDSVREGAQEVVRVCGCYEQMLPRNSTCLHACMYAGRQAMSTIHLCDVCAYVCVCV